MTWHVDATLLKAYGSGGLNPSRVMAVEAHLQTCPSCRNAVPVDLVWLDRSWSTLQVSILTPEPSRALRTFERLGLPGHRFRLLAATPALRWSWLAATAAVLTFAVVAAYLGEAGAGLTPLFFLIFAPILPVLAVATAYGPPVDPMHEITSTTPAAGPALVLWRAAAVVGVSMAMGLIAALLLPGPGWYATAWLLPAFLLCVSSLALATVMALPLAAGLLGAVWLAAAGAVAGVGGAVQSAVFGPSAQTGYLLCAALAATVLIRRRRRLDPGETR